MIGEVIQRSRSISIDRESYPELSRDRSQSLFDGSECGIEIVLCETLPSPFPEAVLDVVIVKTSRFLKASPKPVPFLVVILSSCRLFRKRALQLIRHPRTSYSVFVPNAFSADSMIMELNVGYSRHLHGKGQPMGWVEFDWVRNFKFF